MAEYQLQEGSLEIPDLFKDRTMNLFTLSENSASEFTFVVSRATATREDRVQQVAARLVKELESTLNGFQFESSRMLEIDEHPAIELFYQFKNGEALILYYWMKRYMDAKWSATLALVPIILVRIISSSIRPLLTVFSFGLNSRTLSCRPWSKPTTNKYILRWMLTVNLCGYLPPSAIFISRLM